MIKEIEKPNDINICMAKIIVFKLVLNLKKIF